MFSRPIERAQWHEMGYRLSQKSVFVVLLNLLHEIEILLLRKFNEALSWKKSRNGLTGLPNFKKATAILILALANYLLDIVSVRGPTIWNRRENFGFWGSQMAGKCISQSCSMDISLCQSTPFSVLCTMKYPFTCFLKKASPNVCPI